MLVPGGVHYKRLIHDGVDGLELIEAALGRAFGCGSADRPNRVARALVGGQDDDATDDFLDGLAVQVVFEGLASDGDADDVIGIGVDLVVDRLGCFGQFFLFYSMTYASSIARNWDC